MWFIVVWWSKQRQGYQTFGDFEGAISSLDLAMINGCEAEMWLYDGMKWWRINFAANDKHVPYSTPIG